jgi:hypothetical protein
MQSIGHDGLNNILAAYDDKSADAVCTFAYSEGPGHEPVLFQGRTRVGPPFDLPHAALTAGRVKSCRLEALLPSVGPLHASDLF